MSFPTVNALAFNERAISLARRSVWIRTELKLAPNRCSKTDRTDLGSGCPRPRSASSRSPLHVTDRDGTALSSGVPGLGALDVGRVLSGGSAASPSPDGVDSGVRSPTTSSATRLASSSDLSFGMLTSSVECGVPFS